jgi:hypothetical protein
MSSTIDYTTFSLPLLLASRTRIDEVIMARSAGVAPAATAKGGKKVNKDGTEKVKRKGSPGAWSDWTKKVMIDCDAEIKAFKEAAEKKAGAHLKWISANKGKTSPEWLAFKTEWDASHPKAAKGAKQEAEDDADASDGSDTSDAAAIGGGGSAPAAVAAVASPVAEKVAKRRGPKKLADMTPEERAAHDAKVAERKATKAAGATALEAEAKAAVPLPTAALPVAEPKPVAAPKPAPVAAPKPVAVAEEAAEEDDEDAVDQKIFVVDGQKYIRLWSCAAKDWATGDLWYTNKKGERGAYWGQLMEDGSVNADAEEPELV